MPRLNVTIPVAVLSLVAGAARAEDLTPPPWRAGSLATFQDWDFSAGPDGGGPDVGFTNPVGEPFIIPTSPAGWLSLHEGRTSVWTLGAASGIDAIVPHSVDLSKPAEIWVQVTYRSDLPGPLAPSFSITSSFDTALLADVVDTPLAGGWRHEVSRWTIDRAASFNEFRFRSAGGASYIDDLIIDVRTIPAPGGLAAAGAMVLTLLRRRR